LSAENIERKKYSYNDWKEGKVVMEEWIILDFSYSWIWDDEAEELAKNLELKEWVELRLQYNGIKDRWLKAISKMKLKKWVELRFDANPFWDDWLESICNMEMKDGVWLFFGTGLQWPFSKIRYSGDAAEKVRELWKYYNNKWIHCMIRI
jgi:hypothetical protein